MFYSNHKMTRTTCKATGEEENKKTVRINDKAQDLEQMYAARLSRKLRRMKRKLLLDAMADDPTNSGYCNSSSSSLTMNQSSSASLRYEEDEDDYGEAAFRRGRTVRYHAPSGSMTFDSNSSVYSDLTEAEMNEIQHVIQELEVGIELA